VTRWREDMLSTKIKDEWLRLPDSQRVLPWDNSSVIKRLAEDGHPYVEAFQPVDGTVCLDYRREWARVGLCDPKLLTQLSGSLTMPGSYVMYTRPGTRGSIELLGRYLDLSGFVGFDLCGASHCDRHQASGRSRSPRYPGTRGSPPRSWWWCTNKLASLPTTPGMLCFKTSRT